MFFNARTPFVCLLFAAAISASAQQPPGEAPFEDSRPPEETLFGKVRPDVTFVIREHSTGADMVELTVLASAYPTDLLQRQIDDLGRRLGTPARGLQIYSLSLREDNPDLAFVKATFAIDGLIEREAGIVRLQPLVQAFAGAPDPHTIAGMSVIFDGEMPNPSTVQRFHNDAVSMEGRYNRDLRGLEYVVALRTQDPERLIIPATVAEARVETPPQPPAPRTEWLLWTLLALAAVAAGALVYWTLLRVPAGARR
jgi:hypothetical protein